MIERKEPTVSASLPTKDEAAVRRSKTARPQSSAARPSPPQKVIVQKTSIGFISFVFILTLGALGAGGYALWQLHQTQQLISDQRLRIVELESQLALSDDSATQSLASVSAKVRELAGKSEVADSEIAKLWGTRNVNRDAIADANKKITSLDEQSAAVNKKISATDNKITAATKEQAKFEQLITQVSDKTASADQAINDLKSSMSSIEVNATNLATVKTSLESAEQVLAEQDILLQFVRERLSLQTDAVKALTEQAGTTSEGVKTLASIEKRLKNTEEIIVSLEAFRRTANRDLQQLKQPQP